MLVNSTIKEIAPIVVPITDTVAYTCPANTQAIIKNLKFMNYSASNVKIEVWLVRSGDTLGDKHRLCTRTLATLVDDSFSKEIGMNAGDTIHVQADTATSINFQGLLSEFVAVS